MLATKAVPLSRRSILSVIILSGLSPFCLPRHAFANNPPDGTWSKVYQDGPLIVFQNGDSYAIDGVADTRLIYTPNNSTSGTVTDGLAVHQLSYTNGVSYVDGTAINTIEWETMNRSAAQTTYGGGCVKISSGNTTLSQKMSADSLILSALAAIPGFGGLFSSLSFAVGAKALLQSHNEIYVHVTKHYCDTPPRVEVVADYYSDPEHKRLLKSVKSQSRI